MDRYGELRTLKVFSLKNVLPSHVLQFQNLNIRRLLSSELMSLDEFIDSDIFADFEFFSVGISHRNTETELFTD